jgi:hypothetical protein
MRHKMKGVIFIVLISGLSCVSRSVAAAATLSATTSQTPAGFANNDATELLQHIHRA